MRVDPVGPEDAVALVMRWTDELRGRVICAANVHMVMEARGDPDFQACMARGDLIVADGRPVWLACRLLGSTGARHLRGQDLMMNLCTAAERRGTPIALFGSTEDVLADLQRVLLQQCPRLSIALALAPPFRPLTSEEEAPMLAELRDSGARIVFVALGCPKQERWMFQHRAQLDCAMVGVGAAFEMLAGRSRVAPVWMQRAGLEWAFRLVIEPRRLWRRYARHNVPFVVLFARQWIRSLRSRPKSDL